MRVNLRQEPRRPTKDVFSLSWQDENGLTHATEVQGIDCSPSGLAFRCPSELRTGLRIFLQKQGGTFGGWATVRYCARRDSAYKIGVELSEEAKNDAAGQFKDTMSYYEFLQISPKAEFDTIQRVYRFLATRYHPDNPATGDVEKFLLLTRAFEALSDPGRRAKYDASLSSGDIDPNPTLNSIDYMDGIEGELNRRLAVLSLLYAKRRSSPEEPRVTLIDLEKRMGFPREYLDFATWYLRSKKYVTREDNSDFSLTALGVDYVEANASKIPVLHKMLNRASWMESSRMPKNDGQPETFGDPYELPPGAGPLQVEAPKGLTG